MGAESSWTTARKPAIVGESAARAYLAGEVTTVASGEELFGPKFKERRLAKNSFWISLDFSSGDKKIKSLEFWRSVG